MSTQKSIHITTGFNYLIAGFMMLGRPGLRRYVLVPLLINIVLFAGLILLGGHWFGELTHWIESLLPSWLRWLGWLLWIVFVLAASLILVYTFTLIANLIAAPFNGLLAEKVEQIMTGHTQKSLGLWHGVVRETPRAISRQLRYIAYYLIRAILALVLFFIPLVQLIAGPAWFVFNAWMLGIQYLDYPMDNHKIDFSDMREKIEQQRLLNFNFGVAVLLATMIPVINFFVMPAAVIAAELIYLDHFAEATADK